MDQISLSHTASLALEYVPIGLLKPQPRNPRTHSRQQIRQLRKSLRTYGFVSPILADHYNNIFVGHGRWEAAKLEGLERVPVLRVEHLTPGQIRAYAIADNRLAEKAGWDDTILAIELKELMNLDPEFDITATGFEVPEIDVLIEGSSAPASNKDDPADRLPDDGAPVTRSGDLWQLGRHQVLCGDARDPAAYQRLMQDILADVIFGDPPYNVRIDGHASGLGAVHHREFAMASGEMSSEEFVDFLRQIFRLLVRYSRSGSLHYLCIDWRHTYELLTASRGIYHELKNIIAWVKANAGMGSHYRSAHEFIVVLKNGATPHRNNIELGKHGRNRANVWTYPSVNGFSGQTEEGRLGALHPTVKPVSLVADALLDCSARGEVVLDPFLGSGTSVIAAERVGRTCYAMEIDPLYMDLAVRRWQAYTGDKAIHVATGKSFDEIAEEVSRG